MEKVFSLKKFIERENITLSECERYHEWAIECDGLTKEKYDDDNELVDSDIIGYEVESGERTDYPVRTIIYSRDGKVLGEGKGLKEACLEWNSKRIDQDDIHSAFKKYYGENDYEIDFDTDTQEGLDEELEQEDKWLDSLSGIELFEIMKDKGEYWEEIID